MHFGVMYPGDETSMTIDALDEWIDAVGSLGFAHVVFGDHVVGVDPSVAASDWDRQWPGPDRSSAYTVRNVFREPLVLFGYLAARCDMELVTGILNLPARQTVIVAKQAAEVDILSRGRLRLGIGLGWNPLEFEALGSPFAGRGELAEEQINLLRKLWTESAVTFKGRFHTLNGVGIQELPPQRPIPLWIGGESRRALDRAARCGDGIILSGRSVPDEDFERALIALRLQLAEYGRDSESFGVEPRLILSDKSTEECRAIVARWAALGATHLCLDTRYAGHEQMNEHIAALRNVASWLL